jgi:ferredoxin
MTRVETEIDGQKIEVERDRWALDVARDLGADIPTLCHHPALPPQGACRLCVVEVCKGTATWLATSCDLPIREGLRIRTQTPAVLAARRMTLELLHRQVPDAAEIRALAERFGVVTTQGNDRRGLGKCILCGLCVRACETILGQAAICFSHRGSQRRVGSPLGEASDRCTGCRACVDICPTGHVVGRDDGPVRHMTTWNTDLPLLACGGCGRAFATAGEWALAQTKLPRGAELVPLCCACRRSRTIRQITEAQTYAHVYAETNHSYAAQTGS